MSSEIGGDGGKIPLFSGRTERGETNESSVDDAADITEGKALDGQVMVEILMYPHRESYVVSIDSAVR